MKLVFDARVLEDIASIGAWWRDNRPAAPDLFDDEPAMSGTDLLGGPVDIDALAAYFGAASPVSAPALDEITVVL